MKRSWIQKPRVRGGRPWLEVLPLIRGTQTRSGQGPGRRPLRPR